MSSVADALLKSAVGSAGFVASAYTLTKFIVATPVVGTHCIVRWMYAGRPDHFPFDTEIALVW